MPHMPTGPMPGSLGGGGAGAGTLAEDVGPFDLSVEIEAIIYIYNPPDQKNLDTGAAAVSANSAPPAAPGVASTPSPAAAAAPAAPPPRLAPSSRR